MSMFFNGRVYLHGIDDTDLETPVVIFPGFIDATGAEVGNDPPAVLTVKPIGSAPVTLDVTWDADVGAWIGDVTPLLDTPHFGMHLCKLVQTVGGNTYVDKGAFERQDAHASVSQAYQAATLACAVLANPCKFDPTTGRLNFYDFMDSTFSGAIKFHLSLLGSNNAPATDPNSPYARIPGNA